MELINNKNFSKIMSKYFINIKSEFNKFLFESLHIKIYHDHTQNIIRAIIKE